MASNVHLVRQVQTKDGVSCVVQAIVDQLTAVQLTVVCGSDAWKGSLSSAEVEKLAESRKKDIGAYWQLLKRAFDGTEQSDLTLTVQVNADSNTLDLCWKQVVKEGISYKLGEAVLHNTNPGPVITQLLDFLVMDRQKNAVRIEFLEKRNNQLMTDHQEAMKTLNESVCAKADVENHLLNKFVLVLNQKKQEIARLANCDKKETRVNTTAKASASHQKDADDERPSSSASSQNRTNADDDSDEQSSNEDTDEEKEELSRQRNRGQQHRSTVNKNADLSLAQTADRSNATSTVDRTFVPAKRRRRAAGNITTDTAPTAGKKKPTADSDSANVRVPQLRRSTRSSLNKSGASDISLE